MEIIYGDIKITIPYEKYFLKYGMKNAFGAMFPKHNQDFFGTSSKRATADYTNYFEEYKKWMERFVVKMSKPGKSEE